MNALPPLLGLAPPFTCSRWLGDGNCGAEGKWHIIWTVDLENGIACDEHMTEARKQWVYVGAHPYETVCSMPGAIYLFDENRCVVDEERLGLSVNVAEATADVG